MILPDLQKELAFWAPKLAISDWQIVMRYEADPRDPETGEPVDGLCTRYPHIPKAVILIRAPQSAAEIPNTYDSIIHELLHVRLAKMDGSVIAEENVVWPLAALLTDLRLSAPAKAMSLCKAIASQRTKALLASRWTRARGRYEMDPQQLAALALQAGQLISQEQLSPEVKSLLEQLIALAAGGSAEMPAEGEAAPLVEGKPEGPPMGLQKQDEPMQAKIGALLKQIQGALGAPVATPEPAPQLKVLQEQMATDRAAAVDGLLDTRPDLSAKQRARLRELGLAQGVAKVREDLAELVPAPPRQEQPQQRAKLGLDAPPRRGGSSSAFKPSGNQDMMRRLRISADPDEEVMAPGCKLHDAGEREQTGKLMTMSIWDALPSLRKATQAEVQRRARRAGGEV